MKVSCILLTYNHESFVVESLRSMLEQDYIDVEFIVSDDSSVDNTYNNILKVITQYPGLDIIVRRNESNLGLVEHLNTVLKLCTGEVVVFFPGDDISKPTRVSKTVQILSERPDVNVLSFNDLPIDDKGNELDSRLKINFEGIKEYNLEDMLQNTVIPSSGASRSFRKAIFYDFGSINHDCPTEDSTLLLRGLLSGKIAVSSSTQSYYRLHANNLSGASNLPYMDVSAIVRQYKDDIETAKSKCLIDKNEYDRLNSWADDVYIVRKIYNAFFKASVIKRFGIYISRIFFNKNISRNYKVILFLGIFFKSLVIK